MDTNDFLPFVDHTSEADLVRAKIKDGDDNGAIAPARSKGPPKPVIQDPVLARAVDLIKGLAIVHESRLLISALTIRRSQITLNLSRWMKTILFVCTGNVCRSPMAEALFRRAASGRGDFRVLSAGLGAMDGQPPTPHSVAAMRELGMDISAQRSRALTAELVRQADYIFGMTHSHVDTIVLLYPQAAEKTFLLREFDETLEPFEKDISDPIGSSYEVYVELPRPNRAGHRVAFEIYGTTRNSVGAARRETRGSREFRPGRGPRRF